MTRAADAILDAALKLDLAERVRIAHELLESVEPAPEKNAERAWNQELARRREKIERGEAVFHSLDELRERLHEELSRG
jgi:hypothetical protein